MTLQAASLQWIISWYGMGKTSKTSRFNLPGRYAWLLMECPGFLTLLYTVRTLPAERGLQADLPWQNKVLAALFVIHYSYRAVLFPFLQPSMADMHVVMALFATVFQLTNGLCLGSWLAAYGPRDQAAWRAQLAPLPTLQFAAGIAIFYLGLAANYYHDEELREIRRREERRQARIAREQGRPAASVTKHYAIPEAGLFRYMLYPHYFVEWIEWTGYYMACGWGCVPARMFVINEFFAMLPRAVRGKRWYEERFGKEKIRGKWAVLPGIW
jgi:3-oxo-5-alpha-steroid 4-dehydrogenase 1